MHKICLYISNTKTKHFSYEFYIYVTVFPASHNCALAINNISYTFDRLQSNKTKYKIEQWSKSMPQMVQAHMESYCPSGESCSLCLQPLAEKFRCTDCLATQVSNHVCWLNTAGHTCTSLKDGRYTYQHSARTNVKNN